MEPKLNLVRMNGLGNDFLIYNELLHDKMPDSNFSEQLIIELSSRGNKITAGCDQFVVMKPVKSKNSDGVDADFKMEIYNSDGSKVASCGNATRCVAWLYNKQVQAKSVVNILSDAGLLKANILDEETVSVDMGKPRFNWQEIPLSHEENIDALPIHVDGFEKPMAVSMGNPHMVFFGTRDIKTLNLEKKGSALENHILFPEKTNVEFVNVIDSENLNMRVFERGAGETLACGTGACATMVAASKKNYVNDFAYVHMRGGTLKIEWQKPSGNVIMTGKVQFEGDILI